MRSQFGSSMPAKVRTGSTLWMRRGSSSEPIEVAERKDVTEVCERCEACVLGRVCGVRVFWLDGLASDASSMDVWDLRRESGASERF